MNQKRYLLIVTCVGLLTAAAASQAQERQKLAQASMKFLSVTTDARVTALGDAVTALDGNASAMFFNPSGMARLEHFASVALGQVKWIADIDYLYGSVALRPGDGNWGVFGFSVVSVDYGSFTGTIRDTDTSNPRGYIDTGTFSPTAMALGLGYAKALSDKFSVGGRAKYVTQDLGSAIVGFESDGAQLTKSYSENVLAYDFGILYRTGFRSLSFGMNVNNFSSEVEYEEEGFQLPLTFKIGLAMDAADLFAMNKEMHSLLFAVDAVHPRDYSEQLNFGGEYLLVKTFALRAGYSFPNDEHGFSAGAGFQKAMKDYGLGVDYAYTPFGLFDSVHRFSLNFSF